MAGQDHQAEKKQPKNLEQEALAALQEHRQQSGHQPWNHNDNERLKVLDKKQKQKEKERQALLEGQKLLRQQTTAPARWFATVIEALPQVTLVSQPVEVEEKREPKPTPRPEIASQTLPEAEPQPLTIRVDPELARVAVGLNRASEFFVWSLCRHYFGVPGSTTRNELFEMVAATGVINTRRHLNRILKQGKGVFWRLDDYGHVYLVGYVKLSERLTRMAVKACPQLVATNIPGASDVHIPVGQSVGEFKAWMYAGWLAYRQDPTISRDTLTKLFNCTKMTLLNWEKILGPQLEIVTNYAQTALDPKTHDEVIDYLPGHHYCYVTRRGEIRIRWRQSNTYKTSGVREHAHKGQSRKARTAAAYSVWDQPVELGAPADGPSSMEKLAFDRSRRVPKQYFQTPEQLQRFLKRMAKKGKPGVSPETPRYIYLGEDRNQHGIFELSLDGHTNTQAEERLQPRAEYAWWTGWQARNEVARRLAAAS